jgi:protein TonB
VAFVGFTLPRLIELAIPEKKEEMTEVTSFAQLEEPEIKQEQMKPVEVLPPPPLKSSIKFTAPVIKKDEEVREDDELKSQEELNQAKMTISIADVKGNDEENGKDIADLRQIVTQQEEEKPYQVVEQMPAFPGGTEELMKFIGNNMKYPTISQENGIQGRVICRFVVASNGLVEDIQIIRSLDPYCDKEAIRVLKLLPKFIPGKQNGRNVPVYFTLPVVFKLQ